MTFLSPRISTCNPIHCFQFGQRVGRARELLLQARQTLDGDTQRRQLQEARYHAARARLQYELATRDAETTPARDWSPVITRRA